MSKGHSLLSSSIAANFSKLFVANVIAQAIGLIVYPILTRLYRPEDFGLYNVFMSIGSILIIIANGEYQNAILFPKSRRKAVAVVHSMLPAIGIITALSILFIPLSGFIEKTFKAANFQEISWLLPLYVLISSLWTIMNFWLTRCRCYTAIASYQVTQSLTSAGSKIGFGMLSQTLGLFLSSILAPIAGLLVSFGVTSKRQLIPLLVHTSYSERRAVRKEYRNFPYFSMPATLITDIRNNLPIWILTPVFCLESVGFYGLAITLAFQPIRLFARSLYQVLYQHVAERIQQQKSILPLLRKYVCYTIGIALPLFTALWFVLPSLTAWLLGDAYRETGEYIQLMLPWALCTLIGGVLCFIPNLFQKQHIAMGIEIMYTLLQLLALLVGVWTNSMRIAVFAYAMIATTIIIGQVVWYFQLVKLYERHT